MHCQAAIFFGAFVSALVTSIDAGSVEFTSYFEGDDCSETPHFIYEKTLNDCKVEGCIMTTIGGVVYSSKVDCYENDRVGTATIYADADAPYVLLEHYSPPTGCENWVNGLAFYADGQCRVLPEVASYTAAIAVVNANSSLELQLFNDPECTDAVSDMSVSSTDVEYTCFVGYSESYGLVYYTTASDSESEECSESGSNSF
ncbi:hypothetical protein JG688_00010873 [Phytophthora aleatoria]|uniref:TKL protein kinase n=1 Tax=Phytophthora aleatoria TaxID=2496075 RepID=A0A8J5J505_9STRA|nr:hypothetical protein JG688_00010873 [Phytophthora aleatoria]